MEEVLDNIFPDELERYSSDDDNDDDRKRGTENARKSDIIKANEPISDDEEEDGSKGKGAVKEKKKTRRKVDIFRFKPDMLTNQDRGIKCLYENLSKIKLFDKQEKGPLDEVKALDKLIRYYKEWHFHFMPKYSFDYFLDRCSVHGKNNLIKTYMNNVRRVHKKEINWEHFLNDAPLDMNTTGTAGGGDNITTQLSGAATLADTNSQNTGGASSSLDGSNRFQEIRAPQKRESKEYYFPAEPEIRNRYKEEHYSENGSSGKKPILSKKEYDEERKKIKDYEDEMKRIEDEFAMQHDGFVDSFFDDDQDDISLKKTQKD